MNMTKEFNSLFTILKGNFISNQDNHKYIPFLLMLSILILINISISFRAEKLLRDAISLEKEVAEKRLVYINTKSSLMSMYRRSVIEEIVSKDGLKTSIFPPIIIQRDND